MMLGRYYFNRPNYAKLKYSLYSEKYFEEGDERLTLRRQQTMMEEEEGKLVTNQTSDVFYLADVRFALPAIIIFMIINFVSYGVSQYGWLVRTKK
jgi:hypothetical protein